MATTASQQNNNNLFWVLLVIALLWAFFRSCQPKTEQTYIYPSKELKLAIIKNKALSDSLKKLNQKKDSVRIEYVTRWRKLKGDTIFRSLPCDTILPIIVQACDSVIYADSVLIAGLKSVIKSDSLIIQKQDSVIRLDSLQILALNSEVRKQKRQKRLAIAGAGILGVIAVLK